MRQGAAESNQISALSNFARNMGGSAGTALLTTFLARSAQVHQVNLASQLSAGSAAVMREIQRFAALTHTSPAAFQFTLAQHEIPGRCGGAGAAVPL